MHLLHAFEILYNEHLLERRTLKIILPHLAFAEPSLVTLYT